MKERYLLMVLLLSTVTAWLCERSTVGGLTQSSRLVLNGRRGKQIRREKRKALREPIPPRIETPYGPIRFPKPPQTCVKCSGRGLIRCPVCEGRGAIRATGSRKRNAIVVDRLVGSLWTSVEVYNGHRHHTIMDVRGSPKRKLEMQVRMRNCCGEREDFWIPVRELQDKMVWRMGWQTLDEILQASEGPLRDARECFRCKGKKILDCIDCLGEGIIPSYEPLYND